MKKTYAEIKAAAKAKQITFQTVMAVRTAMEETVLEMLSTTHAVRGAAIAFTIRDRFQVDFTDVNVRAIIRRLRLKGYVIIGGPKGYYIPKAKSQIDNYIKSRKAEIKGELKCLESMKQSPVYERLI